MPSPQEPAPLTPEQERRLGALFAPVTPYHEPGSLNPGQLQRDNERLAAEIVRLQAALLAAHNELARMRQERENGQA